MVSAKVVLQGPTQELPRSLVQNTGRAIIHLLQNFLYLLKTEFGANCCGLPASDGLVLIWLIEPKGNEGLYLLPRDALYLARSGCANFHPNLMVEVWWFQNYRVWSLIIMLVTSMVFQSDFG